MLDRLLRGRGWVMLIAALLAGIVFLNVSVLELNRGIAATTSEATKLEQQNSALRSRLADVGSAEAIQRAAQSLGFVLPQPGDIGYVRIGPGDSRLAASRLDGAAGTASSSPAAPSVSPPASAAAAAPVTPAAPATAASAATPSSTGTAATAPTTSTGTGTAASPPTGTGTASAAPGTATAP